MKTERMLSIVRSELQRNISTGDTEKARQKINALLILQKERILELERANAELNRKLQGVGK